MHNANVSKQINARTVTDKPTHRIVKIDNIRTKTLWFVYSFMIIIFFKAHVTRCVLLFMVWSFHLEFSMFLTFNFKYFKNKLVLTNIFYCLNHSHMKRLSVFYDYVWINSPCDNFETLKKFQCRFDLPQVQQSLIFSITNFIYIHKLQTAWKKIRKFKKLRE